MNQVQQLEREIEGKDNELRQLDNRIGMERKRLETAGGSTKRAEMELQRHKDEELKIERGINLLLDRQAKLNAEKMELLEKKRREETAER